MKKIDVSKILIPLIYTFAILALVFIQWNQQMIVWQGGSSPLYRNLMDNPAYIRSGFNLSDVQQLQNTLELETDSEWQLFDAPQLRIVNSPLPDLPQRRFLSPWALPPEEFTIVIPVELDRAALESDEKPGIYLGYIGENWEIFFNGHLVQREIHLDETGRIVSRRNWRGVHFPVDASFLLEGTNILAFRIIGDPTFGVTGMYYSSPYYMDDYSIIKARHLDILAMALCGIFGYTAIHYLIIFLSVRKKRELYNLFYSISSILLCVYTLMFSGIVNNVIPNSDISIRLEYVSLFMLVPMLGLFIEHFGAQKITKISKGFLVFYSVLSLTQIFFSNQYGDDVLFIWSATVLIYFSYIFFYSIASFYIRKKRNEDRGIKGNDDVSVYNILIGLVVVYLCGIYDVIDIIFLHNSSSLFLYSTFIFHIGMAITLSQRFRGMYSQLEQSNIILEEQVQERTLELKKQTAIALNASREAHEASQAKSDFLAIMSHEIRTPLNAVIGFSEIELRENHTLSSKENIAHIHRSGSFLLDIINEILDISKIESGKLELLPAVYECALLIGSTVSLNRIRIGEKPIRFILIIDADFPAKLIGDEMRVRQILNNLLSNAIKYTEEGSIKLEVRSEKLEGKNVQIYFIVSDTGIGIRGEDIDRLFDNYTQLDTQANRKSEGTGLGLAITRNLAEMMGGDISVKSEYSKGSVFTACIVQELPDVMTDNFIGESTAEDLRNFRYALDWKKPEITPLQIDDCKVLVVDDIPENLMVARGLLKPYGLIIDTAGSGQEAIDKVKKENYSLIFMDHMMPEMDGVQTLKLIREIEKDKKSTVPVIALTSNALRGMKEFYLKHGFEDYITKPVNPQELDEMLRNWLSLGSQGSQSSPRAQGSQRISSAASVISASSAISGSSASPFSVEVDARRLDKLNHFRFAFDSGREVDAEYLEKFSAFIESLHTDNPLAKALAEAGRNGDADVIRKDLPFFYEEMKNENAENETGEGIQEILQEIKQALLAGDTVSVRKMLMKLGAMKLNPEERELYFSLYDFSLLDKNDKALDRIEEYFKSRG